MQAKGIKPFTLFWFRFLTVSEYLLNSSLLILLHAEVLASRYKSTKSGRFIIPSALLGNHMKVFLGWSGSRSKETAEALGDWLGQVIQAVDPWISSDILKGARWGEEIAVGLTQLSI